MPLIEESRAYEYRLCLPQSSRTQAKNLKVLSRYRRGVHDLRNLVYSCMLENFGYKGNILKAIRYYEHMYNYMNPDKPRLELVPVPRAQEPKDKTKSKSKSKKKKLDSDDEAKQKADKKFAQYPEIRVYEPGFPGESPSDKEARKKRNKDLTDSDYIYAFDQGALFYVQDFTAEELVHLYKEPGPCGELDTTTLNKYISGHSGQRTAKLAYQKANKNATPEDLALAFVAGDTSGDYDGMRVTLASCQYVPVAILQMTARKCEQSYTAYFTKRRNGQTNMSPPGPTPNKDRDRTAITLPAIACTIDFDKRTIKIPYTECPYDDGVTMLLSFDRADDEYRPPNPEEFKAEYNNVNLVNRGGKWYFNLTVTEYKTPNVHPNPGSEITIDLGCKNGHADSNGYFTKIALATDKEARLLKLNDRHISKLLQLHKKREAAWRAEDPEERKGKHLPFSDKLRKCLARKEKVGFRVQNRRDEQQRAYAATLAKYEHVHMENLQVKNMTASAEGTAANPGKKVAQKRGLNRTLQNNSLGMMANRIITQVSRAGGTVYLHDPVYTSQRCPECGHIAAENRKKDVFLCVKCGHEGHADTNATANIRLAPVQHIRTQTYIDAGAYIKKVKRRRPGRFTDMKDYEILAHMGMADLAATTSGELIGLEENLAAE